MKQRQMKKFPNGCIISLEPDEWLNERAEQANINFSGVLQVALKELLHIQE